MEMNWTLTFESSKLQTSFALDFSPQEVCGRKESSICIYKKQNVFCNVHDENYHSDLHELKLWETDFDCCRNTASDYDFKSSVEILNLHSNAIIE